MSIIYIKDFMHAFINKLAIIKSLIFVLPDI